LGNELSCLLIYRNSREEKIRQGIRNRFYGSLKLLKNMTKLEKLNIANTDINSGLKYLPDSLKDFDCSIEKEKLDKSFLSLLTTDEERKARREEHIEANFRINNFRYDINSYGNITYFPRKLRGVKEKAKTKARNLLAEEFKRLEEENFSLKRKVAELENDLTIERETNQASAELMDKFYRQNPPREDLALQNTLLEISDDYLKLNRENQAQKQEIKKLKSVLRLTEQLTEIKIQELEAKTEVPPK